MSNAQRTSHKELQRYTWDFAPGYRTRHGLGMQKDGHAHARTSIYFLVSRSDPASPREDAVVGHVPQLTPLEPRGELKRFRETLDFAYENQHVHRERANLFASMLFGELIRHGSMTADTTESSHVHPTIRKATEWFEIHLADPIRVTDIAGFCGITRRHLLNLFRRELGTTPSRFMRSRRARRAHLLLTQTDRPIKLIADDVGIRDLAHFSRIIKQEYGVSPRQIRRGETG